MKPYTNGELIELSKASYSILRDYNIDRLLLTIEEKDAKIKELEDKLKETENTLSNYTRSSSWDDRPCFGFGEKDDKKTGWE